MARESFLMYGSWEEPIMQLSNESKGMLLVALLKYHNEGEIIDLPPDARMAFMFIKKQMDLDSKKYETKCVQRVAAGKISAEKKAIKKARKAAVAADNSTKSTNVEFVEQNQQTPTKSTDNDKENENEKENDVVVVQQQCADTTTSTTKSKITKELIERYRAELASKFYVPGRTDAICRAAMIHYKDVPGEDVIRIANGEPPETDYLTGKPKWAFDRELDIAAALRTWKRRIVEQWEATNGA